MQPDFCKSKEMMPSLIYLAGNDLLWDPLRKSGPNGFISIMMLVMWWGQACLNKGEYETETIPEWNAIVLDIKECLLAITASTNITKK